MKRGRFTEEQIIAVLREHEAGAKTGELARKHGISEATLYNWKAKYGGMDVSEAKRLRMLEDENRKLKKLLAKREEKENSKRRSRRTAKLGRGISALRPRSAARWCEFSRRGSPLWGLLSAPWSAGSLRYCEGGARSNIT